MIEEISSGFGDFFAVSLYNSGAFSTEIWRILPPVHIGTPVMVVGSTHNLARVRKAIPILTNGRLVCWDIVERDRSGSSILPTGKEVCISKNFDV
jgi:hypothetical protein